MNSHKMFMVGLRINIKNQLLFFFFRHFLNKQSLVLSIEISDAYKRSLGTLSFKEEFIMIVYYVIPAVCLTVVLTVI